MTRPRHAPAGHAAFNTGVLYFRATTAAKAFAAAWRVRLLSVAEQAPHISPHLPTSPHISPYLCRGAGSAAPRAVPGTPHPAADGRTALAPPRCTAQRAWPACAGRAALRAHDRVRGRPVRLQPAAVARLPQPPGRRGDEHQAAQPRHQRRRRPEGLGRRGERPGGGRGRARRAAHRLWLAERLEAARRREGWSEPPWRGRRRGRGAADFLRLCAAAGALLLLRLRRAEQWQPSLAGESSPSPP